jgi:uncharacterized membrane protein YhaH (DUF805 family)
MEWMTMPLRRYAEFSGRSRRKEYWMYVLLLILVGVVLAAVEGALGLGAIVGPYGPLSALLALGTFIPSLAVGVRRLHDTGRSGWWMLIGLIPNALMAAATLSGNLTVTGILLVFALIGAIVLLVLMVMEGTKGPNEYGPDPKGSGAGEAAAA